MAGARAGAEGWKSPEKWPQEPARGIAACSDLRGGELEPFSVRWCILAFYNSWPFLILCVSHIFLCVLDVYYVYDVLEPQSGGRSLILLMVSSDVEKLFLLMSELSQSFLLFLLCLRFYLFSYYLCSLWVCVTNLMNLACFSHFLLSDVVFV